MNPEQAGYLERASESLQAARLLAAQSFHNIAMSRAYYAMFNAAKALLLGEGLSFSKHTAVIAAFGQHFSMTGRVPPQLHRYLIDAQAARIRGDYDAISTLTGRDAAEGIKHAEEFLRVANQVLGAAPPGT